MGKVTVGSGPKMRVPLREVDLGPCGMGKIPTLKTFPNSEHLGVIYLFFK